MCRVLQIITVHNVFTSSHHLLLHARMCGDCAAITDAMSQKSGRT